MLCSLQTQAPLSFAGLLVTASRVQVCLSRGHIPSNSAGGGGGGGGGGVESSGGAESQEESVELLACSQDTDVPEQDDEL